MQGLQFVPALRISIHALRVEGDRCWIETTMFSLYFYPRPPGGGRPYHKRREMSIGFYFYPRPPGGGRPLAAPYRSGSSDFYPRPPGGGRRGKPVFAGFKLDKFLSTPSGWRATVKNLARAFNMSISIHALRVEGDRWWRKLFNQKSISIHALRVEGDKNGSGDRGDERDFYPRPPGGGRLVSFASRAFGVGFLSTPSGWRATTCSMPPIRRSLNFYPRPPGGGRRAVKVVIKK